MRPESCTPTTTREAVEIDWRARAEQAEKDLASARAANAFLRGPASAETLISNAQKREGEASQRAEKLFDCHGDPPNCGACISCLLRDLESEKAKVSEIVSVAHKHGWNGVENSKILSVFIENELASAGVMREIVTEVADALGTRPEFFTGPDAAPIQLGACVKEISARAEKLDAITKQKDGAYSERDQVVAAFARLALASGLKAWTARHVGDPWDEDWRGIVFIALPTGQASWHYHDSEAHLFADLPKSGEPWDGHDTPEKYRRMQAATYVALLDPEKPPCGGSRCWKHADGTWLHSSKSYSSCKAWDGEDKP